MDKAINKRLSKLGVSDIIIVGDEPKKKEIGSVVIKPNSR